MSRQHEEAYARWRKTHDEECQRDLLVGAKVYRPAYDRIEEGTVERIDHVRYTSDAHEIEDPDGPYTRYFACFGPGRWESQTFQWRWFYKVEDAKKLLARQLRERAEGHRRDADKCDALAASIEIELCQNAV